MNIDNLVSGDEYINFVDDVTQYLGIGYTFNNNFENDVLNKEYRGFVGLRNFHIEKENYVKKLSSYYGYNYLISKFPDLKDNEIVMGYQMYNTIYLNK